VALSSQSASLPHGVPCPETGLQKHCSPASLSQITACWLQQITPAHSSRTVQGGPVYPSGWQTGLGQAPAQQRTGSPLIPEVSQICPWLAGTQAPFWQLWQAGTGQSAVTQHSRQTPLASQHP
jgi:hypothetical protein